MGGEQPYAKAERVSALPSISNITVHSGIEAGEQQPRLNKPKKHGRNGFALQSVSRVLLNMKLLGSVERLRSRPVTYGDQREYERTVKMAQHLSPLLHSSLRSQLWETNLERGQDSMIVGRSCCPAIQE